MMRKEVEPMLGADVSNPKPHIMIVEDEGIIAENIRVSLKGMGYEISAVASSAEAAIEKAAQAQPDLIIMDIRLGNGMDGVEAAQQIRQRFNTPVVYLTGNTDNATLQRAKMTEPLGYITKPYKEKDLQITVEMALHKCEMERRLRESERWLLTTLRSIGDGVITTDANRLVKFMNGAAENLTGWTSDEAEGRSLEDIFRIINEDSREQIENPVTQAIREGKVVGLAAHTILLRKDGTEIHIDDKGAPIKSDKGEITGAVMVFHDITERMHLEDQLRQSQKLEAIGRLAGGVAHDFNNLLTAILGYSRLTLDQLDQDSRMHQQVEEIEKAGKRAAALTSQLLAFSRKQVLQTKVLDLNSIITDMEKMIGRLIGEDIELITGLDPALGNVRADPGQLEQVILNLAVNARDAMPRGGKLTIETKNAVLDASYMNRHIEVQPGHYVILAISDTGMGMDKETLSRVFEPFFTTKEMGKGTGLGLATIYGIVKQSRGYIWVYSEPGKGTTFKIYLPRVDEPAEVTGQGVAEATSISGVETILLVEDEGTVREIASQVLQARGYTILNAANAAEAILICEQHEGTIHLMVTDVVMPKMSGRELADHMAHLRPQMKVLYMSGYTESAIVHHGVLDSNVAFIQKPFSLEALAYKVREVLAAS